MFRRVGALAVVYAALMVAWWALDWTQSYITPGVRRFKAFDFDTWVERPAWIAGGVLALILAYRIVRELRGPGLHKWGTTRWNRALLDARLVKDDGPQAKMVGKVRVIDDTVLVTLRLPAGLVASAVAGRLEQVAASLDVPVERLHITRNAGRPGLIDVRVDPAPREIKPRGVDLPAVTTWRDPVLVGQDMRGRDVHAPTYDIGQWLAGGITGSGKTTALRLLAAHYALDPLAIIWGADGKGSRDDWGPLRHRAARWVDVTDDDASGDYLRLLRDVVAVVMARNREGGRDHAGMLVILEEATAFRAGLDTAETTEADKLLTRIVQTCRSANVLVVVAAQRPSSTLMSTNVRAQAGVSLCMRVRSAADAEMVLGYRPEVAMPEAVGRGLLDVGDGTPRAVLVDHLTESQWRELCATWTPAVPVLVDPLGDDEPQDTPVVDPLEAATRHALIAAQRPLTPAELWERLPAGQRTASPATLGRALAGLGIVSERRTVAGRQARVYALDLLTNLPTTGKTASQQPQDAVAP